MQEILARPFAYRQARIESGDKTAIEQRFGHLLRNATRSVQVRVAPHQNLDSRSPTGPNCLPGTLVMPTIDQHRIVLTATNDVLNLRRIKPGKSSVPGWIRDIPQKGMGVSGQERHIPIEFDAKASTRLLLGRSLMTVVDMHVQVGLSRQGPKPGRVILDRMSAQYGEPGVG